MKIIKAFQLESNSPVDASIRDTTNDLRECGATLLSHWDWKILFRPLDYSIISAADVDVIFGVLDKAERQCRGWITERTIRNRIDKLRLHYVEIHNLIKQEDSYANTGGK